MGVEVTDEIKVCRKAAFFQHQPGVAANREDFSRFNKMVVVQGKGVGAVCQGAFVDYRLAIIFTGWLQRIDIEQPVGG